MYTITQHRTIAITIAIARGYIDNSSNLTSLAFPRFPLQMASIIPIVRMIVVEHCPTLLDIKLGKESVSVDSSSLESGISKRGMELFKLAEEDVIELELLGEMFANVYAFGTLAFYIYFLGKRKFQLLLLLLLLLLS